MRKTFIFFICLFTLIIAGCGGEPTIKAHNIQAAFKSLNRMKYYLPEEQRMEFEIGFWTIRDALGSGDEFLDTVDGKTAPEIIELGKKYFQQRKAAGIPAYTKYASWDDMINKVIAERKAQSIPKQKMTQRDKDNNVLYNLRAGKPR
ncbi:hypothetical protein [Thiolapillus sp.]|uniref:hypothetical protein n=1 Tax=Thiolapillus sp. TaxID=2017437 RepID=UPI003AF6E161